MLSIRRNNSKLSKQVVLVTDFRRIPLAAALSIFSEKLYAKENVELWISRRSINFPDYGDNISVFRRRLMVCLLISHPRIRVVGKKSNLGSIQRTAFDLELNDIKGIMSSLISITSDSEADKYVYPEIYNRLQCLDNGAKEIRKIAELEDVTKLIVFNGRLASNYNVVNSNFGKNINVEYYEFPTHKTHESVRMCYRHIDFPIHDFKTYGERLDNFSREKLEDVQDTNVELERVADEFQSTKLSNRFSDTYKSQPKKIFDVVIFLSSLHEVISLSSSFRSPFEFLSPQDLISKVIEDFGSQNRYAVRAHPNELIDKNWRISSDRIHNHCENFNVEYFSPMSDVSSFDLMRNAQIVVVDVSSAALDAILMEVPVKIYGWPSFRSAYERAISTHKEDRSKIRLEVAYSSAQSTEIYHKDILRWGTLVVKLYRIVDFLSNLRSFIGLKKLSMAARTDRL